MRFAVDGRGQQTATADTPERGLRAEPALAGVPCIAVSANAMPADIADALRAGFDAYITKPIASARLFAEVDRVLAAQQA